MAPSDGMATGRSADDAVANNNANQLKPRRANNQPTSTNYDSSSPAPSGRRASSLRSIRTDSSSLDARPFSFRSSTDDLLAPRARENDGEPHLEPSLWYSVPLLFAVVPAIGGVAFKSGNVFLTDLSLLILAAIYLNYCLVTPWTWYQSARSVSIIKSSRRDIAVEDPLEDDTIEEEVTVDGVATESEKPNGKVNGEFKPKPTEEASDTDAARSELQLHELAALLMCFLGPPLGAYILHILRESLSSLGDELVSNIHLTLFVLGAEIRPIRHAIKLIQARTLHLQRIIREDPRTAERFDSDLAEELGRRVHELEASVTESASKANLSPTSPHPDNSEQLKKANAQLQTQIDALNRAVRRYEKRATAQTMQTEARLQDLETRLREALSLAAAAATYTQKPGLLLVLLDWLASLFMLPLRAAQTAFLYPLLLLSQATNEVMVMFGLAKPARAQPVTKSSSGKPSRDAYFSRKLKN